MQGPAKPVRRKDARDGIGKASREEGRSSDQEETPEDRRH